MSNVAMFVVVPYALRLSYWVQSWFVIMFDLELMNIQCEHLHNFNKTIGSVVL